MNLNPRGDNFLSVRAAPTTTAAEKDRLRTDDIVYICDHDGSEPPAWLGIVYAAPIQSHVDCGTGTPSPYIGAYRGPCRHGWVSARHVELVAG